MIGKKSIGFLLIACSSTALLLAGCSNFNSNNTSAASTSQVSVVSSSSESAADSSSQAVSTQSDSGAALSGSSHQDDSARVLLTNIESLALQGKIINCVFPVKSTNIAAIQEKWGKADTSDYVSAAKGTYDTYSKYSVAFGYNKGAQIFEVRSFDKELSKITMSLVKKEYGKPGYDYKSKTEEVLGYKVTDKFKVLFVFSIKSGSDPALDHYSVFYPDGTINSMAGDPGREW